jgi:hypothetical protein
VVGSGLVEKSPVSEKIVLLGIYAAIIGLAVSSRYLRKRFAAWQTQAHSGGVPLLGLIVLAAMAYIGSKPLIEADPCGYSGKIETDWFVSSRSPL